MIVVQDRNKLLNRYSRLVERGTGLKLYHEDKGAAYVTSPSFRGHMAVANVYRNLIKLLDKAKSTKTKDEYATFVMAINHDVLERIRSASGAFLEQVAIEALARNKNAIEGGFERIYGQKASVVIPDAFWGATSDHALSAMTRFEEDMQKVMDKSLDDTEWAAFKDKAEKSVTRRVADEAFLLYSKTTERVQGYAGVTSYVWRTMKDNRVVGNPNGLYPVGSPDHMDHWHRDGKTFEWSNPPADGHPGQAYGCRCHALPLMTLNNPEIR